jgi:hypothetical protein
MKMVDPEIESAWPNSCYAVCSEPSRGKSGNMDLRLLNRSLGSGLLLRCAAIVVVCCSVSAPDAHATVFDWPSMPGWTAAEPTINGPPQTVDYSSTGQNISVTMANSGATWNAGYPQVVAGGTGPFNGGTTNNGLIVQPVSQISNATNIQFTINFGGPVTDVSFQIWDIDATVEVSGNGFIDLISHLQATAAGGGTVFPDIVDNTHTSNAGTTFNFINGSGAGLTIRGDPAQLSGATNNTDEGTLSITFSQPITQISFWYSNDTSGSLTTQTIGIGPLTYTIVPEVVPSGAVSLLCGVAASVVEIRRRRRRLSDRHR